MNPDDGDLLLAYYFVPDVQGGSLAEKVETLVAEAEKLGEDGFVGKYKPADSGFGLLDDANFQRFFSADIESSQYGAGAAGNKQLNGKPIVSEDGKSARRSLPCLSQGKRLKKRLQKIIKMRRHTERRKTEFCPFPLRRQECPIRLQRQETAMCSMRSDR